MNLLDQPVWNALNSGWSDMAQGDDEAKRIDPRYGPFGAARDNQADSRAALARLVPDEGELWMIGQDALSPPPGTRVVRTAMLAQMVAPSIAAHCAPPPQWRILGEADAPDMQALSALTRPGPFAPLTHRLGRFIGLYEQGALIAMAGERMRLPGHTEVSGVCTHPDWRGRGLAGSLMRAVMQAMLDRGETPFLHAYAAHDRTIALYRTLGFNVRAELPMMVVTRG